MPDNNPFFISTEGTGITFGQIFFSSFSCHYGLYSLCDFFGLGSIMHF